MKKFLLLISGISFSLGFLTFESASTIIHQLAALLFMLISMIGVSSIGIINAIEKNNKTNIKH